TDTDTDTDTDTGADTAADAVRVTHCCRTIAAARRAVAAPGRATPHHTAADGAMPAPGRTVVVPVPTPVPIQKNGRPKAA
ncbi:TPA: hypothetical protein ACKE3D_005784, partial [Burkholderia dolosa]